MSRSQGRMAGRTPLGVVAAALALALAASAALAQEEPWDGRFWNPKPAGEGEAPDFVLPLPCGGAMAFRPVYTRLPGNWLHDEEVRLGRAEGEAGYSEYARPGYIAGSITDDEDPGTRRFYLGKYEVTQQQYDAVMTDECARPRMRGRLPVAEVSWFEAVDFANRWTLWLKETHPEALPRIGSYRAFLRLPTETEWEYAARGGDAVNDVEFQAPLFPMPAGGLDAYAWFNSPSSCQGEPETVGLKQPNPLGLHDMLGNVEEMVLEPYHMTRGGRLHGQAGGLIAKGGSCLTDRSGLHSAMRTEYSFYDDRGGTVMRPPLTGFRVVVAGPVVASHERIADYREDWAEIQALRSREGEAPAEEPSEDPPQDEEAAVPPRPADDNPVTWLETIAGASEEPAMQAALGSIAAEFRGELADREQVERRAAQAAIQAGASIIRQYRQEAGQLARIRTAVEVLDGLSTRTPEQDDRLAAMLHAERASEQRLAITRNVYANLLSQTAEDYPAALLEDQLRRVGEIYEGLADAGGLVPFARRFVGQVTRWQSEGPSEIETLTDELEAPI